MPRIPRRPEGAPSTVRERIMHSLAEPAVEAPRAEPTAEAPEPTNAVLREWARANGHDVSDSGPIPKAVREAYDAAHEGDG